MVFVDVLGIDAEADAGLVGEVSGVLAVALGLSHRLGERVPALVNDRRPTSDRDVLLLIFCVVNYQSDSRIAADVAHPAAIPVSVESEVVFAEQVMDDDLPGRAVRSQRGQHRTSRRGKELAHWIDQTLAVAH